MSVAYEQLRMVPIVGGYCVKQLDDDHCVDLLRRAYNWRLVVSPRPPLAPAEHLVSDHGWCYFGHGVSAEGAARTMQGAFLVAFAAALRWDGTDNPPDYDKQAF